MLLKFQANMRCLGALMTTNPTPILYCGQAPARVRVRAPQAQARGARGHAGGPVGSGLGLGFDWGGGFGFFSNLDFGRSYHRWRLLAQGEDDIPECGQIPSLIFQERLRILHIRLKDCVKHDHS